MARLAVESRFGSVSSFNYPDETYDSTKLGLGSLIKQYTGVNPEDKFVGPIVNAIGRPVETSAAIPGVFPWAMQWSSTVDWIFLADNATAAATRRIQVYTFNRTTSALSWGGFITLAYPFAGTQGTYTIRAFRMTYDKYTEGTVGVSGTAVTGSGTAWQTSGMCVGNRIGFGSVDPTQISTWYEISAVGGDTSITLTTSAGTITSGTAYVIEDLRAVTIVTNATTLTNGGVFVAKGLRYEIFTAPGTSVAAATTVDNTRANYWLKDASTETNTVAFGSGIQDRIDWTTHYLYVGDTLANPIMFKYNLRAALTVASGASTNGFVLKTGAGGAVTGTTSQNNNGRLAMTSHGPGSGVLCFYFATTTRIYRTVNVDNLISGSTAWITDAMTEIPPGATTSFAATATMSNLDYSSAIDRFIITTAGRAYVTQYKTDTTQLDRIMFSDNKQTLQTTADLTNIPIYPVSVLATFTAWTEGGMLYLTGVGTSAITNFLYAIPMGADWEYAATTNQRAILPKMSTPNVSKFVRALMTTQQVLGGRNGKNLGLPPEPARLYYRTSGIDDNTGTWNLIDYTGDISGVGAANEIQFMVEWRTIGTLCIPSRIFSVTVIYDDLSTDSHYQPSVANSSTADKQFAWRFSTAFGGTVPTLQIRVYDAITGSGPIVDDDSVTRALTWEKSTDGGSTWGSYNSTDKANDTTYIRVTCPGIGDNTRVRALLTQL